MIIGLENDRLNFRQIDVIAVKDIWTNKRQTAAVEEKQLLQTSSNIHTYQNCIIIYIYIYIYIIYNTYYIYIYIYIY